MLSSTLLFISGQDTIVILVVALFLFGGKKLPELARGLGQGIREFKDASEGVKRDIQDQINKEVEKAEVKSSTPAPSETTTLTPDPSAPVNNHPGAMPIQDTNFHADPAAPETHATEPAANTVITHTETPEVHHPRETPL
ncbi:twin-arginine translocase TatA/TatE family subunit [Mucilaginibacter sp. HMF5004]|uniref:Sec-independent protein translocase subunit TatA/TatB n=1 Tax=Mucilaginibacter rivuli TaxID=2857527 RepID=UPI001C60264F|nr:twin-arginine translocase TatA/TatE family subunit [Mucilaginibacter rivuli]MBW4889674.1 twin-arginine translocase TatA/TatE family subunit [Mucilaginibacter rivuli]